MTDSEYEFLKIKAAVTGLSMQSYISKAVQNSVISSQELTDQVKEICATIHDMDRQLKGIANNINQLAHIANATGLPQSYEQIRSLTDNIEIIRREQNKEWLFLRQLIEDHEIPTQA